MTTFHGLKSSHKTRLKSAREFGLLQPGKLPLWACCYQARVEDSSRALEHQSLATKQRYLGKNDQ